MVSPDLACSMIQAFPSTMDQSSNSSSGTRICPRTILAHGQRSVGPGPAGLILSLWRSIGCLTSCGCTPSQGRQSQDGNSAWHMPLVVPILSIASIFSKHIPLEPTEPTTSFFIKHPRFRNIACARRSQTANSQPPTHRSPRLRLRLRFHPSKLGATKMYHALLTSRPR